MSQIDWASENEPDNFRSLEDIAPLEQALTGGTPQRVGGYRFYFNGERWEWSPEVEKIHGYQPGTVTPTTRLVLSQKHPDDYEHVAATLDDIRRTHKPFSTRHRIISQAVAEIAVIEQAKGALMYVYRVEAGAAFDVLKWRSQETNVKLRALAEQLLADIRTLKHDDSASYRAGFDRLLLTTHQRVRAKAARSHW